MLQTCYKKISNKTGISNISLHTVQTMGDSHTIKTITNTTTHYMNTLTSNSRSKKYKNNIAKVKEAYKVSPKLSIEDAVSLVESMEHPNFKDGVTLELHFKLNINPTKSDQLVRSSVVLPHGTGKKLKVAAFVNPDKEAEATKAGATIVGGEELIDSIKKSGKVDFDIAIAQPDMMKKLPIIARILGTAGVMPNPKTGTVSDDVAETISVILKGKVNFKNDKSSNIHFGVGKIGKDFTKEQLIENIQAAYEAVEKSKPEAVKRKFILSAHIAAAMSPSVRIG